MDENESASSQSEASDLDIRALMSLVQAAMVEIEQAKRERSKDDIRAARTQLAALHGVARLRRQAEREQSAA